jgi:hypothetical protein
MRGLFFTACLLSVAPVHAVDVSVVFAMDKITMSVYCGARNDAAWMFSRAGIRLKWVESEKEDYPTTVLVRVLVVSSPGPANISPTALAYATPFNNHPTIFVLYNRLVDTVARRPQMLSRLLGHVLAHEIGHILQRSDRHAESGVMKAGWSNVDYEAMARAPLPFTPFEIEVMQDGLASWRKRAAKR